MELFSMFLKEEIFMVSNNIIIECEHFVNYAGFSFLISIYHVMFAILSTLGEGGPYEQFAGHECGIALAKMSFDTTYLDDISGCQSLSYVEKDELDNWIQKFTHYRCYPVRGRLIADNDLPDPNRIISSEELAKNNGDGEIPAGYAAAPIYVGAGDKVYDMSFGGVTFYGKGCSYNVFAGRDASRALALMSLDPKDAMNPDVSDLDEKKIKVLNDWINTFSEKKKYPVVGTLKKN